MAIILKTGQEIDLMKQTGKVLSKILTIMGKAITPGITTKEIETIAIDHLKKHNAVSASLNYPTYKTGEGYPSPVCLSVNDEVVHGIASDRILNNGDIITLDLAILLNDFYCDSAITVPVGNIGPESQKLIDITNDALYIAMANIKPNRKWSEIAIKIQNYVEGHGFDVVSQYVGHGIGKYLHEDPKIPITHINSHLDFTIQAGMTLAIEPIVVIGSPKIKMLDNGWTAVTEDGKRAAHFEHTIAVTDAGAYILTLDLDGK